SLLNFRAREKTARLGRMNPMTRRPLIKETMDDIDLLLQRLEGRQSLAELHFVSRALRPPMILIDSIAEENDPEPFRERADAGRSLGGEGLQPRQGHRHAGAAKNRAAGNSIG